MESVRLFVKLSTTLTVGKLILIKDAIIFSISKSTIFVSINMMNGFYRILVCKRYIPYIAYITLSGMIVKGQVRLQGLTKPLPYLSDVLKFC